MAEYIDREALMKFPIRRDHCDKEHANEHFINGIETVMEYAKKLPAVDVAPVVHGRWEKRFCHPMRNGEWQYICSVCKDSDYWNENVCVQKHNYCPNCGAKMDGGDNDAAD